MMINENQDTKKQKIYLSKINKEISSIAKNQLQEINELKNDSLKKGMLGSGAYLKKYINIILKNYQIIATSVYKYHKEVFFNGFIDSMEKKNEIVSKLESLRNSWIRNFRNIETDSTLRDQPIGLLKKEYEKGIEEILRKIKTDIEIEYREKNETMKSILVNSKDHYEYDFALSFAGENRDYVREVAEKLKKEGISIFYDEDEEVGLWGKYLPEYFDDIYRKKSKYCIVFISKYYKEKVWARHERRCALERALRQSNEYILPVKFDETEIIGLGDAVGFLDARKKTPEEISKSALQKMKKVTMESIQIETEESFLSDPKIIFFKIEPDRIKEGEIAKLSWKVENISYPLIIENIHEKGGKGEYNFGSKKEGFFPVSPLDNVNYKLIAKNSFGKKEETIKLIVDLNEEEKK